METNKEVHGDTRVDFQHPESWIHKGMSDLQGTKQWFVVKVNDLNLRFGISIDINGYNPPVFGLIYTT